MAKATIGDLLKDLLGQDLAQLHAPLVEAVDVPYGTLGKCEVFVIGDQSAQLGWADMSTDKYAGGRSVAEEDLVRHQVLGNLALGAYLIGRLPYHQGFGLREVVGRKHLLVEVVADGVVRLGGQDEIGRNQLRALVDELEERVLRVGARLTE